MKYSKDRLADWFGIEFIKQGVCNAYFESSL